MHFGWKKLGRTRSATQRSCETATHFQAESRFATHCREQKRTPRACVWRFKGTETNTSKWAWNRNSAKLRKLSGAPCAKGHVYTSPKTIIDETLVWTTRNKIWRDVKVKDSITANCLNNFILKKHRSKHWFSNLALCKDRKVVGKLLNLTGM